MIGYDLDGVLATNAPVPIKPWRWMSGPERNAHKQGLLKAYSLAGQLYRPREPEFVVITARKDDPNVREVTERWLNGFFPGRVKGLYMLGVSRSLDNVIDFKATRVNALGLTDFTEDNVEVVKGLRKRCLKTRVWLYAQGQLSLNYRV